MPKWNVNYAVSSQAVFLNREMLATLLLSLLCCRSVNANINLVDILKSALFQLSGKRNDCTSKQNKIEQVLRISLT